jgi:TM2 domain-containing membrane protein YozV
MIRPLSAILGHLAALALLAEPLHGQHAPTVAAPGDSARPTRVRKSRSIAVVLGLVLPGAGHWYAGESGRGTLTAATYWTGVALVAGGRTDRVGHVGGLALLGALGFSIVDGARAAERSNRRPAPALRWAPRDASGGPSTRGASNEALQLTRSVRHPWLPPAGTILRSHPSRTGEGRPRS